MSDQRSRKWLLTINNPLEAKLSHDAIKKTLSEKKNLVYWCMADEIGLEKHTPHTHIYMVFRNAVSFNTIKKLFPTAHADKSLGSSAENKAYVQKSGKWAEDEKADTKVEGTFEEFGELPEELGQGSRSDISNVYAMIADGLSNGQIMEANPSYALHISRMDKIRQDILEDRFRNTFRELDVTYIWGPTGTGKTRGVMESHGFNVYRIVDYSHPFDRFASESVLCFDEFRSSLPIGDMLNYLDGYPIALPARYVNRTACYEKVYIISNISLQSQYPNVQDVEAVTWQAFLRRIHHVIEYKSDKTIVQHGSAADYINNPSSGFITVPDDMEIPF